MKVAFSPLKDEKFFGVLGLVSRFILLFYFSLPIATSADAVDQEAIKIQAQKTACLEIFNQKVLDLGQVLATKVVCSPGACGGEDFCKSKVYLHDTTPGFSTHTEAPGFQQLPDYQFTTIKKPVINPGPSPTPKPADRNSQGGGAGSNPSPQSAATGDSSADLSRCNALANSAISCCRNPASCLSGAASANSDSSASDSSSGLTSYCKQMQDGGLNNGTTNRQAANICLNRYSTCMETCSNMAGSYSGDVASQMMSLSQQCRGLSSLVSQMTSQSLDSLNSAGGGANCQSLGGASPQSLAGNQNTPRSAPNDPYGCQKDPGGAACQQCSRSPNLASCQAMAKAAAAQQAPDRGSADFKNASADDKAGKFNLSSAVDLTNGGPSFAAATAGAGDNVPQVKPIANNSGGGIPGGGGGSGLGAKLDAGRRPGAASPGSPGISTDIEQGFQSGGGYSAAAGGEAPEISGRSGGRPGRGGAGGRDPAGARIDLKQFLPGGRYDPNRLGGAQGSGLGIHGPHVDIWECIHDRLIEKCRLGELYDCGL